MQETTLDGLRGLFADARSRFAGSARLRRSFALWTISGLVLAEAYAASIALLAPGRPLILCAALTAGWWLAMTCVFAAGAAMLDAPDGSREDRYGAPNGVTALRAWFCVPVLLTALLGLPGREGLALYAGVGGAAGLLDAVDGLLARTLGPITKLGRALDPFMDALFFIVAAIGSFVLSIMPLWLTALIVFRYAGPLLLTPVVFLAGKRPELVHTPWGRRNTALIGVVLFTLFWVRVAAGPVWLVALVVALPLLVPTLALHLVALVQRTVHAPTARASGLPAI